MDRHIYEEVHRLLLKCISESDAVNDGTIKVEGLQGDYVFDKARIEEAKPEIASILREMDGCFAQGYSFLQLPFDKNGRQWGEQPDAGHLVALGLAAGFVEYCFPRGLWDVLPGGVPYIQIKGVA